MDAITDKLMSAVQFGVNALYYTALFLTLFRHILTIVVLCSVLLGGFKGFNRSAVRMEPLDDSCTNFRFDKIQFVHFRTAPAGVADRGVLSRFELVSWSSYVSFNCKNNLVMFFLVR